MGVGRIKGQDVEVRFIENGQLLDTLTEIKDFEVEEMMEVIRESYLGQTTEAKDDVYKGCKFKMTLHVENADFLRFSTSIKNRARRRSPGTVIKIQGKLKFPNGETPKFVIPDCFFDSIPMRAPKREDYVEVTYSGEAEELVIRN